MGGMAKLGIPGIIIALIAVFLGGGSLLSGGGDSTGSSGGLPDIFNQLPGAQQGTSNVQERASNTDDDFADFSANVMLDVQESWERQFTAAGSTYERAGLVFFDDAVSTACGNATSAVGPFYCPGDQKVYLDLSFQKELANKFGADGDFAWAYVIAHEVGHHVQYLTGVNQSVREQSSKNPDQANDLSVRQELQADCLAGIWAKSAYEADILESGDLEEGLTAAERVGDDWIQKNLGSGRVNPDAFTHGTSEQRQRWFTTGYETGDPSECDTFGIDNP
jgi:predicted metalloprotease